MPDVGIHAGLSDREAVIDAVLRFVIALDDNDEGLLISAFTEDAVVDLGPASVIGIPFSELSGRDKVAKTLLKSVGPLDTTHMTSNFRVSVVGDTAQLSCYALASHFRPGQGPSPEHHKGFTMANRYTTELVRDDGAWRIRHMVINCTWSDGDIGVITGGS